MIPYVGHRKYVAKFRLDVGWQPCMRGCSGMSLCNNIDVRYGLEKAALKLMSKQLSGAQILKGRSVAV